MASVQSNSYDGRYLKLTVEETATSIASNTSTLTWTLESIGGNSIYYTIYNCSVVVNGQTVYDSGTTSWNSYNFPAKKGSVSGTVTVNHKADGTADAVGFTLHGRVYYSGDDNKSGSVGLSTIPRYTSITRFNVNKRNETSVVFDWLASDSCDGAWYSKDNGASWSDLPSNNIVGGLSPNTTYNFKLRVRRKDSQLTTDSSTVSQTTYKAPSNSFNAKTETTIKVNWSIDSTADYIQYSKDNGSNWTNVGSVNATSGTYEITGLSANTTYNIKTRVRRKDSQTSYDTATLQQATYDYPKPIDARSFIIGAGANEPNNIEAGASVHLYNPLGRNCKLEIISKVSNTEIGSYSGTHNGWVIGELRNSTAVSKQYASIPNAQNGTYYAKVTYGSVVKTYDVNNTYSITGNEKPTFNNFSYADINTAVTNVTGNNQILVKGLSNLRATISSANKMVGNYSATGKSYIATIDTLNKSTNYSTGDLNIDVGTVVNAGTKRLTITAYDSRNLYKEVYKDITVMDYAKPVINVNVSRQNNFENQTTLKVSGTYTRLTINNADKNTITSVQYRYREANGTWSGWTTLNTTVTAGQYNCSDVILSLDNTKSFEFEIQTTDRLQTNNINSAVGIGQAIFFISTNNKKCYVNGEEVAVINKYGYITTQKGVAIPNNGNSKYGLTNGNGDSIIRDHNNGCVTVDATGNSLFLGWENTKNIDILHSRVSIDDNGNINSTQMTNINNAINSKITRNKKPDLVVGAGQTKDIDITGGWGLVAVRCWRSYMEVMKIYAIIGPSGWAYTMKELADHQYVSGGSAVISHYQNNGQIYVRVQNTCSNDINVAVSQINIL